MVNDAGGRGVTVEGSRAHYVQEGHDCQIRHGEAGNRLAIRAQNNRPHIDDETETTVCAEPGPRISPCRRAAAIASDTMPAVIRVGVASASEHRHPRADEPLPEVGELARAGRAGKLGMQTRQRI